MNKKLLPVINSFIVTLLVASQIILPVNATEIDYKAEAEARKGLAVQTNQLENWPQGPAIGAQAAILMDANTGAVLYAKNIDEKLYPASTTKILTCLIAAQKCEPDEVVTFSEKAIYSIEPGSSNIGMDVGQSITMDQALHGILILSANEVANAVGEHISGSAEAFVELMNQTAADLGCKNSHFMNANGLHDDNHYTTAYDLATIARAFFSYDSLCTISGSTYCTFEATPTQPDSFTLATKNQLVKGKAHEYEYLVGSKTGYTSISRQTLVSCAKKDGMKLICVVLKEESPAQFTDTIELFNYGFSNFSRVNIADNDTKYTISGSDFFSSGADVFGSSDPLLSIDSDDYLILPSNLTLDDLDSDIVYETQNESEVATITYSYHDHYIGTTHVALAAQKELTFEFEDELQANSNEIVTQQPPSVDPVSEEESTTETESNVKKDDDAVFVNVKWAIIIIAILAGSAIAFLIVRSSMRSYRAAKKRRAIMRRRRRNNSNSEFKDYKF